MCQSGGNMLLPLASFSLILLGFAYLVISSANKEQGWFKLTGQIIGWAIAVLVIVGLIGILVLGKPAGMGMGGGMGGKSDMGCKMMMMKDGKMSMDKSCPSGEAKMKKGMNCK